MTLFFYLRQICKTIRKITTAASVSYLLCLKASQFNCGKKLFSQKNSTIFILEVCTTTNLNLFRCSTIPNPSICTQAMKKKKIKSWPLFAARLLYYKYLVIIHIKKSFLQNARINRACLEKYTFFFPPLLSLMNTHRNFSTKIFSLLEFLCVQKWLYEWNAFIYLYNNEVD